MPQVSEQNQTTTFPVQAERDYLSVFDNGVYYPEQRETDMGETSIHIKLLTELLQILDVYLKRRDDAFISGNMNLYYEEGNARRWFAPDLLIAFGVPNVHRSSYLLWREKVFPQVVFEISSEKTWRNDIDEKLEIYDGLGAEEYYVLDPEFAFLPAPLMAFHRQDGRLTAIAVDDEKVYSPRLGLEIVRIRDNFRLFNPASQSFLMNLEESDASLKESEAEVINGRLRAIAAESEIERLKAEIEKLKSRN